MPKIVAFAHRKRVGKDTAARFLDTIWRISKPGKQIIKVSFAAKLKDVSYQLFHWAGLERGVFYEDDRNAHLKEVVLPKIGKSPRQIWIEVGNYMRQVYPDIWIDNALYGQPHADFIIITDMRFPNEADKVKALGGVICKINRPDVPKSDDASDTALEGYAGFDHVIENVGDLKDLHRKVEDLALWLVTEG